MKTVTANQIKRMEPGTKVKFVIEGMNQSGTFMVVRYGRKKKLKTPIGALVDIVDKEGCHYEVNDGKTDL